MRARPENLRSWLPSRLNWVYAGLGVIIAGAFMVSVFRPADTVSVLHVIDGDTLKVNYRGAPERLRLIGIDCPESILNARARKQAGESRQKVRVVLSQGQQAKRFVQSLLKPGTALRLEWDVERRDKYGRLLAYAFLPDGSMLNERILRSGYAYVLTVPPNVRYQALFLEAFREGRENRQGLWK